MPEKGRQEIPRSTRELFEKGMAAFEKKNYDYAIAIFGQVLQNEPGYYECREALRATQFKRAGGRGGLFRKVFGTASTSSQVAKAQIVLRNQPLEAIKIAEGVLTTDPSNVLAHKTLAEAALAADLPRTAVLSLEIAFKSNPKDKDIAMKLGQALTQSGDIVRAERIYADLEKAHPGDPAIGQALKNVTARRTMREGGYEGLSSGSGSYRDILKDKDEAVALEQEQREVKSSEVIDRLLSEQLERLKIEPENRKLLRSIGELYAQKNDFDSALQHLNQILDAEGGTDPSLEKTVAEIRLKQFEQQIARLNPEEPDQASQREQLQKAMHQYRLDECRSRSERYPNDLQIRFELGTIYFEQGKFNEAIQEFQKAQNNPNRRIASMRYLGQAFSKRGMQDLAARTLQNALKEKVGFDDEKKELIYLLGEVFEKVGKPEQAVEQYKQIYEVDIGYRDVAAKVDAYYAAQNAS